VFTKVVEIQLLGIEILPDNARRGCVKEAWPRISMREGYLANPRRRDSARAVSGVAKL
jgi:hypothetical protein